jgi:DNA sulfur modification protein DndB
MDDNWNQKGAKLIHLDHDDLVEVITPYARGLGAYFGRMSTEDRKGFRDLRGIQGQNARTRHAQAAIRQVFPDFTPPGLDDFLKLEKEQTNLKAKEVIDRIERILQTIVVETLKSEFGNRETEWWTLGVPKKVRLEAAQRSENDDAKRGTKDAYFELMDYRRIALEHWDLFARILGYGTSGNKERKTKWMVTVNDKRNIVSHASSGVALKVEELNELEEYERFLIAGTSGRSDVSAVGLGADGDAELEPAEKEAPT